MWWQENKPESNKQNISHCLYWKYEEPSTKCSHMWQPYSKPQGSGSTKINEYIDDYGDRGNRLKDSRTQNSHPAHSGFG